MNPTELRERLQALLDAANTSIDDGLERAHSEPGITEAYRASDDPPPDCRRDVCDRCPRVRAVVL
jgi:hypothetical protein